MSATGIVRNGVVVFDGPAPLPDGTAVRVEAAANGAAVNGQAGTTPDPGPTWYERLKPLIDAAGDLGLPPDAALNHDHYLYGHPKKS